MRELVGKNLGKYRIVAYLGGGGMADVYKAYHPGLDRHVAIKVMKEHFAAQVGSMNRFEREAVAVARLRHPNIVQVHDFEAQGELSYLVMEFIEGPTLRHELQARRHKRQAFSPAEIGRLFSALTDAVDYAHSHGVIHRDLKPENVMITLTGQVVLTDFGIAQVANLQTTAVKDISGTPLYMAPEQGQGQQGDQRSDIYSLGVVLYEMATGRVPFEAETPWAIIIRHMNDPLPPPAKINPNISEELEEVILKALEKSPDHRYQAAGEMGQALQLALGLLPEGQMVGPQLTALAQAPRIEEIALTPDRPPLSTSAPRPPSPYRGLFAFREADAPFFFGREAFVAQLVETVGRQPLVAVLGPSGSGKSSVVFAGLLPRLRRGTMAASMAGRERTEWYIASCRPGGQPFQALAATLLSLLQPTLTGTGQLPEVSDLAGQLQRGETGLSAQVARFLEGKPPGSRVLLILDQFEEIFTLCSNPELRNRFIDSLLAAVEAQRRNPRRPSLTLLLTMRADFLNEALAHRALADALQEADVKLGPMTRQELDRAIENPAGKQGVLFETGLAGRILDDVGDEPGNLPLLEFALTLLWERQESGLLTHAAYEAIGRVEGALAHYADEVYNALNPAKQLQARQLFIQLVRPGHQTEDTRRLALRAEIGEANWTLARGLANARLVVTGRDAAGQETIEVVHEALIRGWSRLRGWMEGDRAFRMWQERLRLALRQWETSGQDEGALLRGALLNEAESWLAERPTDISPPEQAFVQAGVALRRKDQMAREEQRRRLMVGLAGGLALMVIAFIVTLGLAVVAWFNWQRAGEAAVQAEAAAEEAEAQRKEAEAQRSLAEAEQQEAEAQRQEAESQRQKAELQRQEAEAQRLLAEEQRRLALTRQLVAQALNYAARQPDLALLLSLEADRIGQGTTLEARRGLLTALETSPRLDTFLRGHLEGDVNGLAFSPDGQILASAGNDGTIILWDMATNQPLGSPLTGHTDWVNDIAFSPDGQTLASAGSDQIVILWDIQSRQPIGQPLAGHADWVGSVVFSPDGKLLASAGGDQKIILWDVATGQELGQLAGHTSSVRSLSFSPASPTLASAGDDGTVIIWNTETKQPRSEPLVGHTDYVNSVVFSPDGQTLVSASRDGTIILWNMTTRPYRPRGRPLVGHTGSVINLALSADGQTLASSSWDRTIILWDMATGQRLGSPLTGHTEAVWDIAFSPDGQMLASAGADGALILWQVAQRQHLGRPLVEQAGGIWSVAFSPNGQLLASASADNSVILWDMATRQPLGRPLSGHTNWVHSAIFSPDGKILASGSDDRKIILWDVATGTPVGSPLTAHDGGVLGLAFSPDGRILASASTDNTVILWDMATRQPLLPPLAGHDDWVWSVAFSPDGQRLVSAGQDGLVLVWDVKEGRQLARLAGHTDGLYSVVFSPDGQTLASAGLDTQIILWDAGTYQPRGRPLSGHTNSVLNLAFSPDSRTLASTSWDNTIILWDVAGQQPFFSPMTGHTDKVQGVAFSPDGQTLVSGGWDGTIVLWDAETGQRLTEPLTGHQRVVRSVAVSPDGTILAWGSEDNIIYRWDLATDTPLDPPLTGHTDFVNSLAFSPDGQTLASGGGEGTVILWDVVTGEIVGGPLEEHTDWIRSVAFSPDGRLLASASGDQTVILWDAATRKLLRQLTGHTDGVRSVAFSPDGKMLASGSQDNTIILWDVAEGRQLYQLAGHTNWVNSLAFSPDGRILASASDDQSVRVWDTETGQSLGSAWTGHTDWVAALAFSPDGTILASGGYDDAVILWDVATAQPLSTLTGHSDAVNSLAFSPDGKRLISGGGDGAVIEWDVDPASWQAWACRVAGRNMSWAEWQQFLSDQPYRATCPGISLPLAELYRQADTYAQAGQMAEAEAAFGEAVQMALETELAVLNNNICWFGTIAGFAGTVLPACDHAVELAGEDDKGFYRDSRGLARALAGDFDGAIEDFEFFLDWSEEYELAEAMIQKRRDWLAALKSDRNPFDKTTLAGLREE